MNLEEVFLKQIIPTNSTQSDESIEVKPQVDVQDSKEPNEQHVATQEFNELNGAIEFDDINSLPPEEELRQKGITKLIEQWTKPWPNKQIFAVTEITGCILQTYFKLKGLSPSDIDESKLLFSLDLYGRMGDTIHDQVYKTINFKYKEILLTDQINHVRGKLDGITHNGIVYEIKSGKEYGTEYKQLALQYHLCKVNNVPIRGYKVWFPLTGIVRTFDEDFLEKQRVDLIYKANLLYMSITTNIPPLDAKDTSQCNFCPISKYCSERSKNSNTFSF
jgi:hypothetical protein